MQQDALVTVDVSDIRFTCCGRSKPRIISEDAGITVQRLDINQPVAG